MIKSLDDIYQCLIIHSISKGIAKIQIRGHSGLREI